MKKLSEIRVSGDLIDYLADGISISFDNERDRDYIMETAEYVVSYARNCIGISTYGIASNTGCIGLVFNGILSKAW